MSLPLGYSDLALGTTIVLPHIDGKDLQIKVPAGTNSGTQLPFPQEVYLRVEVLEEGMWLFFANTHAKEFDKATKSLEQLRENLNGKGDIVDK